MKMLLAGLFVVVGLSLVGCAHHCKGGQCDRSHGKAADCGNCEKGKECKECKKGDAQCDREKKSCCEESKKAEAAEAAKTAAPAK